MNMLKNFAICSWQEGIGGCDRPQRGRSSVLRRASNRIGERTFPSVFELSGKIRRDVAATLKTACWFACLLVGSAVFPLVAAPPVPAPHLTTPLLLRGGTVHPVSGPSPGKADVLIVKGRIAAIGSKLKTPADAQIVDVAGRHLYPGLIAANTVLGVHEISSIVATQDIAETGQINPNARAQVAVNPDNSHLGVTRLNGILSALVTPYSTSAGTATPALIAGQSALMRLDGWTWEEMTLRDTVALHVYWPDVTLDRRPRAAKSAEEQQKEIDRKLQAVREAFATSRAYQRAKDSGGRPQTDTRWEAMRPYLRGERPVFDNRARSAVDRRSCNLRRRQPDAAAALGTIASRGVACCLDWQAIAWRNDVDLSTDLWSLPSARDRLVAVCRAKALGRFRAGRSGRDIGSVRSAPGQSSRCLLYTSPSPRD